MKRMLVMVFCMAIGMSAMVFAGDKSEGEKCFADFDCEFNHECKDGVCIKKREFDAGSSGKTGKSCFSDADCIGSGKCVEGNFGKKYCSGN
jgi:hypothetical protein